MSQVKPRRRAGPSQKRSAGSSHARQARRWAAARAREARYKWTWKRQLRVLAMGALAVFAFTAWLGGFAEAWISSSAKAAHARVVEAGFVVRHVDVRGVENAEADAVEAALMIEPGEVIFNLDPDAARQAVEALDWVERVAVVRLLPDRVVVLVTERAPVAVWRDETGATHVVDGTGTPIAAADPASFADLPVVAGPGAKQAAAELAGALAAAPEIKDRAAVFERRGGRRWDVITRSGLVVRLPEGSVRQGLERLAALHAMDGILDAPLAGVDLRGDAVFLQMRPQARGRERGA